MARHIVHIIDDDEAVRRSTGFMLKASGFCVKTYDSGDAFLKDARNAEPGCILLDVRMPGMDGLEVQDKLRAHGITMPVIILTGHGDIAIAVKAMKAGAIDFIEKPFEKSVLVEAINEGMKRLGDAAFNIASAQEASIRLAVLSPRERDVLEGLVHGHPNKTIAYDLGISPRTVEVHRANVMAKLEVRSLSDALRLAFAAGIGHEHD